jgi:hypothetical protein
MAMETNLLTLASQLSDEALLARVKLLSARSCSVEVELIAHLAVLDQRKRYRAEGSGTLFRYCTDVLRFSESAAYHRIKACRAVRKFPVILGLLADCSVNLTTVRLLAPHLTAENHEAVLAEAAGMRKRQVEKLVARLAPKPDVPSTFRKLPAPATSTGVMELPPALGIQEDARVTGLAVPSPTSGGALDVSANALPPAARAMRSVMAPVSPDRYRVQFTVGGETEDQLRRLQDLLRGEIPDGDPGLIFARALPLLLQAVEKQKFAATSNPRPNRATATSGSRHIPAEVAREVWDRDRGQCAFVAASGRRCSERSLLEFHHRRPFAMGGEATVANIALRCRAHNAYEAEVVFGGFDRSHVGGMAEASHDARRERSTGGPPM